MRAFVRVSVLGGASLGLLMLVAVGSRQEGWRGDGGTLRDVPHTVIDSAYTLGVFAVIAIGVGLVLALRRGWPEFHLKRESSWISAVVLITFAVFFAYVLATTDVGRRLSEVLGNASRGGQQGGAGAGQSENPGGPARDPQFQWWLAVLIAGGAVGAYVWWRRSRRPRPQARRELAEELELVLSETLDDLESEPDPRRAVIRAYARMETVLAAHGLPRNPAEAPLEYLARVLRELHVRADAAHALTELFERAKFSQHEIDVAMKEEAIAALATVRDDLKAAA
jgi:uncharacterized protein DUF4129